MKYGESVLNKVRISETLLIKCEADKDRDKEDFMFCRKSVMGGDLFTVVAVTERDVTTSVFLDKKGAKELYSFLDDAYKLGSGRLEEQKKEILEWVREFASEMRLVNPETKEGFQVRHLARVKFGNLITKIQAL